MIRLNYLNLILWFSPLLISSLAGYVRETIPDWENQKVQIIDDMVEKFLENSPGAITVVGSQNVHNADGSLKEIRTVELVIPNLMYKKREKDFEEYMDKLKKNDEELEETLLKMQKQFRWSFGREHIDCQAGFQKLSESGDVELEIYATKDEILYQDTEGVAYYDKENITKTDKLKMAEEFKHRYENKPNTTIVSALVWDENGKLDNEHSQVEPMLLAYVDEASDSADEDMMDAALKALSLSALEHPDEVAKEVSAIMSKEYPDYTWFVTHWQEEDVASAKHDVFIKVTYDNVDLGEDFLEYSIYGVKK